VLLETSSYLPLLWRTPYTQSVLSAMANFAPEASFAIQADCIREAAGYLSFEEDWKYHPGVRIRRILAKTKDAQIRKWSFPSAAIQILLGGNIWPQGRYLNFVRHTTFFLSDLIDEVSFDDPRRGLEDLANRIDTRIARFRHQFNQHEKATTLMLPTEHMLPYWGLWYCLEVPTSFRIDVLRDDHISPSSGRSRDLLHYEFALLIRPLFI
jgi:hypothetical protein